MKRTLKKAMSVLLAVVMVYGMVAGICNFDFAIKANAEETEQITSGYYTYIIDEYENAVILDVDESISGEVEIPSTLDGYPVTSIGENAFHFCANFSSITIPDSVKTIDDNAFSYCKNLTSIILPDSLTTIEPYVFYGCTNLTNITIPYGVTNIDSSAFGYCMNLASIIIPNSVITIGDYAFTYCTSLTSVIIPNSVKHIGSFAFNFCKSLASVTIPDSVISIGNGIFEGNESLEKIIVNENNSLYSADEHGALFDKDKKVLIQYCPLKTRTSYTIPNGVTSISSWAFGNCSSLLNIVIPDSVTTIESNAFFNCSNISDVYYTGMVNEWKNITIGSSNECLSDATIHYNYDDCTHIYTLTTTILATCTSEGIMTYICDFCGDIYTETTPATGHDFGDWVVVKESTLTEEGIEERICSQCGETEEQTIELSFFGKLFAPIIKFFDSAFSWIGNLFV